MTEEQLNALDAIVYAHDEMRMAISDISSMAHGGDIGWNQGCELSAHVGLLLDKWEAIEKALAPLHPLRER